MARPQSIPNLIQGVSQQAPQQRRDSQCEAQFDCINSALEGCVARPQVNFVKLWASATWSSSFLTELDRGDENYLVGVLPGGTVFAIDLADGTDCTVSGTFPNAYLGSGSGSRRDLIRSQAVEDTVFLVNRTVPPAMASTTSAAAVKEALIFVRAPAYASYWKITVTGPGGTATSEVSTPRSDDGEKEWFARTDVVASLLALGGLDAWGDAVPAIHGQNGYSAEVEGPSFRIWRADGQDFTVSVSDDNGGDYMLAFKGTVPSTVRLPARAFPGMRFAVQADDRGEADQYYVEFQGSPSTGKWTEVVGPSVATTLNAALMPHLLVNTGYRTFTFGQATWSTRIAGDADSAKQPSFVGRRIRDIFHHQRRLAFLHASGCVWSKAEFPYTLFPDTVQTVLATAPIDVRVESTRSNRGAATLDFAVLADEGLYLWGQGVQFRVGSGQETFKQDSVEALPSSAYEYAPRCDPLALGTGLYFGSDKGAYASVRSVQFSNTKVVGDVDVTSHIPHYIRGGLIDLTASDTLRTIVAVSAGFTGGLYLYNFTFDGDEIVQSAWNTWRIPGGPIIWASIKGNSLRLLQQRTEGVALLTVDLTPAAVDAETGAEYMTRVDHRVNAAGVTSLTYNSGTGNTSFVLPYTPTCAPEDFLVVTSLDKPGGYTRGRVFEVLSLVGSTVTVRGDLRDYAFYAGQRIVAERTESRFYVRNDKGVLPVDRLVVNRFQVEAARTGYTRVEVATPNKPARKAYFEGRVLGTPSSVTETLKLTDAAISVDVGEVAENATITLINDSYLPSAWQSAAYEYEAVGLGGLK